MNLMIKKSILNGSVSIPSSKSYSHRHLIMALLSKGQFDISNLNDGDDIEATINVSKSLGCEVSKEKQVLHFDSTSLFTKSSDLMDVYASGSTLRFFIPICLTQKGAYRFYLRDRLKERSLKVYEDLLKDVCFKRDDHILEISGKMTSGIYHVDGSHSSQFLSGLMMAFPLLDGDSELIINPPFVSQDYFRMTLACMEHAGIEIEKVSESHYKVKGNQTYKYQPYVIESDASAAVFIKVAKYLGLNIDCRMTTTHFQKDAMIDEFLESIQKGKRIFDVSDCPDLVPALSLALALSQGSFEIVGAGRLKDKESNRLEAIADVLNTLGACIIITPTGLLIDGVESLKGGQVDSYLDHRIAMMAVIAGLVSQEDVILTNANCISKSWPSFYTQIKEAGGRLYEL